MRQQRMIVTRIDDIVRMLADYCGNEDVPADSRAITLQFHPTERGKLSIVIDSPTLTSNSPLEVRFDLRQQFVVGAS